VAVIIAYYASPEAASAWWVWALYTVSTVISIGLAMGVWKGKQARDMAILGALLTLGSSLASSATTAAKLSTNAVLRQVLAVANTAISVTQSLESFAVAKELEEIDQDMEGLKESAEMYESNLRYAYGESFTAPIRAISEEDPYKSIKDTYDRFSSHKSEGFRGNGFDRPFTYGWG
jgi:hypothetical protein